MHQSLGHDLAKKFLAMQVWRPESESQNFHQKVRMVLYTCGSSAGSEVKRISGANWPANHEHSVSHWSNENLSQNYGGWDPSTNSQHWYPVSMCTPIHTLTHTHITHLHTHEHIHTIHCLLWFPFLHKPHSCVTYCSLNAHFCLTH